MANKRNVKRVSPEDQKQHGMTSQICGQTGSQPAFLLAALSSSRGRKEWRFNNAPVQSQTKDSNASRPIQTSLNIIYKLYQRVYITGLYTPNYGSA